MVHKHIGITIFSQTSTNKLAFKFICHISTEYKTEDKHMVGFLYNFADNFFLILPKKGNALVADKSEAYSG